MIKNRILSLKGRYCISKHGEHEVNTWGCLKIEDTSIYAKPWDSWVPCFTPGLDRWFCADKGHPVNWMSATGRNWKRSSMDESEQIELLVRKVTPQNELEKNVRIVNCEKSKKAIKGTACLIRLQSFQLQKCCQPGASSPSRSKRDARNWPCLTPG